MEYQVTWESDWARGFIAQHTTNGHVTTNQVSSRQDEKCERCMGRKTFLPVFLGRHLEEVIMYGYVKHMTDNTPWEV